MVTWLVVPSVQGFRVSWGSRCLRVVGRCPSILGFKPLGCLKVVGSRCHSILNSMGHVVMSVYLLSCSSTGLPVCCSPDGRHKHEGVKASSQAGVSSGVGARGWGIGGLRPRGSDAMLSKSCGHYRTGGVVTDWLAGHKQICGCPATLHLECQTD